MADPVAINDPHLNLNLHDINVDLPTQEILLAASQHDVPRLRDLIRTFHNSRAEDENAIDVPNPVNVKDPETGYTPLHAAIASCEREVGDSRQDVQNGVEEKAIGNGVSAEIEGFGEKEDENDGDDLRPARDTVKFLLQEGAIWNDLDKNDETPGCIARRMGLKELYELMVDAGVRAELLFSRLEGYERLEDDDDDDDDDDEEMEAAQEEDDEKPDEADKSTESAPTTSEEVNPADRLASEVMQSQYLHSNLTFQPNRLLDEDKNGVMMTWETSIMSTTAQKLLPVPGLRVLNVGHGMGIIDKIFQERQPSTHHIVEAHPDVIAEMKRNGWYEKEGVHIHEGRWQDILPALVDSGETFDAIYYDTFAESYADFREFCSEYVIALLDSEVASTTRDDEGSTGVNNASPTDTTRWSFFNGMGADRQISYDVYQKVVEMDLFEAGFDVEWDDIKVPDLAKEWDGVRRPYWVVDNYRLPLCRFMN